MATDYCRHADRVKSGQGCRGCEHSIDPFLYDGGCILSLAAGKRPAARLERLKNITEHERKKAIS